MRRVSILVVVLAALLMPMVGDAQDFIRYYPPQGVAGSVAAPGFSYASNVGSLANGTTSQTFAVYNTFTNASNYERGTLYFSSNDFWIGTQNAGTGAARNIYIYPSGGAVFIAGNLYPSASDNSILGFVGTYWQSFYLTRSIQGSKSKTLTDAAAAVSFVRIAVPTNGYIGGELIYTANSTDGTNRLTTTGRYNFAGADTGGTVTCGTPNAVGTPATAYRRGNTLVCTVTAATSTTNCDLQVTCTDNLAGDQTPTFEWRLDMPSPNTVTPQ